MSEQTQALQLPSTFGTAVAAGSRSTTSRLALGAIRFYRHYLSPLKGFKCASGVMGGQTCSTAGLAFFSHYPLREAFSRQRQQFRECGEMMRIFNIAVRHDRDTAIDMIATNFGKDGDEALRLFNKAVTYKKEHTGNTTETALSKKEGCGDTCGSLLPCVEEPIANIPLMVCHCCTLP